jgi:hypothetical protein
MRGPSPRHQIRCGCGAIVECRCLTGSGVDHRRACDACEASWPQRLSEVRARGRVVVTPPPEPDVLKLVPPTADIAHLDRVFRIDEKTSPLVMLELWRPTDPVDEYIRSYLIAFGRSVLPAAEAKRARGLGR